MEDKEEQLVLETKDKVMDLVMVKIDKMNNKFKKQHVEEEAEDTRVEVVLNNEFYKLKFFTNLTKYCIKIDLYINI